jgi:hypothetical protein
MELTAPFVIRHAEAFSSPEQIMADDEIDPTHEKAMRFATNVANAHSRNGGDVVDLLATYALYVVQEDAVIGMTCLDAVSMRFLGAPASHI